jgi:Tfp pilus assembly protein PilO
VKTKPSQGAQLVLVVVSLVAAAAACYLFLIGPKRSSASETVRQVQATQVQIDRLRARAADAATPVTPQAAVDAAELFSLAKAVPDSADMAGVLLELNRIATDTGIVFDSITPGALTPAGGYQVLPIGLAFEGNFYELSDFLFRVRSLVAVRDGRLSARGRLYNVESVSFAEATFPRLKAQLTVNAYVFGGDAAAAAPAQPSPAPAGSAAPDTGGAS